MSFFLSLFCLFSVAILSLYCLLSVSFLSFFRCSSLSHLSLIYLSSSFFLSLFCLFSISFLSLIYFFSVSFLSLFCLFSVSPHQDLPRCKPHYLNDLIEDLNWFGIFWNLGPGSCLRFQMEKKEFDDVTHFMTEGDPALALTARTEESSGKLSKKMKIVSEEKIEDLKGKKHEKNGKDEKVEKERKAIEIGTDHCTDSDHLTDSDSQLEKKGPSAGFFFGVDLSLFSGVFLQSKRKDLYLAAWRRLLALKLGEWHLLL